MEAGLGLGKRGKTLEASEAEILAIVVSTRGLLRVEGSRCALIPIICHLP